eukprot:594516-Prymnesium_polylepis.2
MRETPGQCCNSCGEVRAVYQSVGAVATAHAHDPQSKLKWENHPLCLHEAVLIDPSRLRDIKEGCRIVGALEVNKVAGNFHLAPGKAFQSAAGQVYARARARARRARRPPCARRATHTG